MEKHVLKRTWFPIRSPFNKSKWTIVFPPIPPSRHLYEASGRLDASALAHQFRPTPLLAGTDLPGGHLLSMGFNRISPEISGLMKLDSQQICRGTILRFPWIGLREIWTRIHGYTGSKWPVLPWWTPGKKHATYVWVRSWYGWTCSQEKLDHVDLR